MDENFIVQKYLWTPYLIDGLKFDLWIYVLLLSIDPLNILIYEEGIARFATEKYDLFKKDGYLHQFMHLTNYAINKENNDFNE